MLEALTTSLHDPEARSAGFGLPVLAPAACSAYSIPP